MSHRDPLHRRPVTRRRALELTGTFDFKWPLRSVIRVAFQADKRLSADETKASRAAVEHAFRQWGMEIEGRRSQILLSYRLLDREWPAPDKLSSSDRDDAVAQVKDHDHGEIDVEAFAKRLETLESTITWAHSPLDDVADLPEYDVLVSFAPLPVLIRRNGFDGTGPTLVEFPQSELGTYARREDLGLPTIFLGRSDRFASQTAWLESNEGRFTFVHEVGHILGLAHEHQNPNRALHWSTNQGQLNEVIMRHNGGRMPVARDFAALDVTTPWAGGARFSEWRTPERPTERVSSIMAKPFYAQMLTVPEPAARSVEDEYRAFQGPTADDLQQLRRMYSE